MPQRDGARSSVENYFYRLWKFPFCQHHWVQSKHTGCGSQRKQCSCYSTKTNVNSNLIWLRWETYTLKVVFVEHHTQICVYICFSTKSNSIWGWGSRYLYEFLLSNNNMSSLRTKPQSVTLWLYPVNIAFKKVFLTIKVRLGIIIIWFCVCHSFWAHILMRRNKQLHAHHWSKERVHDVFSNLDAIIESPDTTIKLNAEQEKSQLWEHKIIYIS